MSLPSFTWSFASAPVSTTGAPGQITPGVDWALQADGDIEFPLRFTTGLEAVAQGVQVRLGDILGECFLNQSIGVEWIETPVSKAAGITPILGQRPNLPRTRATVRKVIVNAPGVARIESMTATFAPTTRRLTMGADIRTSDGALLAMGISA